VADIAAEKDRNDIVARRLGVLSQRGSRFLGDLVGTNMIAPVNGPADF
jgi:hypothetical protein